MFDDDLIRKANLEIGRLNRELVAIHEDEERCKLRRSGIEAQKAEVQLFISQANLVRRLAAQPGDPTVPKVHIERHCGVGIVRIEKPKPVTPVSEPEVLARVKRKPDGLPSVASMIVTALRETGKASRPSEVADFVRGRWWPAVQTKVVGTMLWQMAQAGKLTHHDGRYGLNGAGHNGAGH
jgi:hypothetical protein